MLSLKFERAKESDLASIIALFVDDELGKNTEDLSAESMQKYHAAFKRITADASHALMVVKNSEGSVIGTCHLTLMPTLLGKGSTRLNIEAVQVKSPFRSQGVGKWMFERIVEFAKENNVKMLQLTSNKIRTRAKKFYENFGFIDSHVGMKMYL